MIHTLELKNFRNFSHKKITFSPGINIIIAPNGSGKSNILEALSLPESPFVETDMSYQVQQGTENFFLRYTLLLGEIGFSYEGKTKKKKYLLEQKSSSKQKFLSHYPHIISFHPSKMNLMYSAPKERRDFLDSIIIQSFPEYKNILTAYKKVLQHRNMLLRNIGQGKSSLSEMEFWDEKYIAGAIKIYEYRKKIIDYYIERTAELKKYFFGKIHSVHFSYISDCYGENIAEILHKHIRENREKECLLGKTLLGPHRDDFDIILNDTHSLIHYASRGEVKSILLGLIFIESDFLDIYSEKKEKIFLIDDIVSELDTTHRHLLWKHIGSHQSMVTSIEDIDENGSKIFL